MKIISHRIPYKHCYFRRVCRLVKMASKTVIRPFEFGPVQKSYICAKFVVRRLRLMIDAVAEPG